MKYKKTSVVAIVLAAVLVIGMTAVFAANKDTGSFHTGDIVTVQITADSVSDLYTYEFELHYDNTALEAKSIHSAIDQMWAGAMPIDEGCLVVNGIPRYDEESGERLGGEVNGENMLICEIVMEVLRDGPVDGLYFQRHYVSNSEPLGSPTKSVEIASGWDAKVIPLSEEQRLIFEGQETNVFEPQKTDPVTGLPEMTYSEGVFDKKFREPGYLNGEYSGELLLNVEKQDVSPGESFWVEVSLNEPTKSLMGQVYFWFNPDELTYQGFEGDEELHPRYQFLDSDSGRIVCITFVPLEENDYRIERFGNFSFTVSEDAQLSGRQASIQIVAVYDNGRKDEFVSLAQSGEISASIR